MQNTLFSESVAEHVWRTKYQWAADGRLPEPGIEATWDRVAMAVAAAETHHHDDWRQRFRAILNDFRFLPGGRILAGAGTARGTTLFNCFVMGDVEDSIHGIFNSLRETVATLQAGGGTGIDFSTLRPAGSPAVSRGGAASGPVSFMTIWETASAVLESGNLRRGAMMAALRCDHPDIEAFIEAKMKAGALTHFNLSVLITDNFMQAVEADGPWPLVFPIANHPVPAGAEVCERVWSGDASPQVCRVHRRIPARSLWERIVQAQHASCEPGVLFVDRINQANNLWYCERISATNPCGEVPLPAYGGCNLGSINLSRFVNHPFASHPDVDLEGIRTVTCVATRFLDDVHEISSFPLKAQAKAARASRRIGLGVTGLADMFVMLGLRYGSPASIELTRNIMATIRDAAYGTSIEIAGEKGEFPAFDKTRYCASPFILDLPRELQDGIATYGIRNSHLLAVAPAGSISLLANNVSSGIEPIFCLDGERRVRGADGQAVTFAVKDNAWRQYLALRGPAVERTPSLVQAADVDAEAQLQMMAAVQPFVDSAIAKTVHLPEDTSTRDLELVLLRAWELGLKGCAVYRESSMRGAAVVSQRRT